MAEHRVPVITIRMADGRGQRHRLSRQPLTMGRDPGCDIHFDLDNVSRQHAHVQWTEHGCEIRDLDSRNGVWVNDERVSRKFLQPGDRISLGRDMPGIHSITFELVTEAEHEHEHRREERSSVDDSSGTSLGMLPLAGRNAMVIGRDPRCHLPLDSPLVSRQHARIDPGPQGSYIVTDLQSKNGTFINGRRVTRAALRPGDRIRIGPFKFIYQPGNLARFTDQGCIRIEGIGLTRQVLTKKGPKTILNRVSLCIQPREFVALVGGSGAGKSTLLDALSGAKRASGAVRVNDEDLYASYDAYRSLMGYVPQEDIIHRELTVDSALRYAARLRLPPDLSEAEIEQRIAQALREVQLEDQRHQIINSLSGGQRKRASIAVELLGNPSLFFLDEPTSGLDPSLEKKMMLQLRELANNGRTVILVTHATANLRQCDHVVFMAQGRMVFFGPPDEALRFFGASDFADIYDIIDRDPAKWEHHFHASPIYDRYVRRRLHHAVTPSPQAISRQRRLTNQSSALRQFFILTQRNLELIRRDYFSLFVLLAVMPIIGLLLALIAGRYDLTGHPAAEVTRLLSQDGRYQIVLTTQKLLLMMALAATLLGIFGAAYEIVKEQAVYKRERMINLKIGPYVSSKVAALFIFALIQCVLLLSVVALKVRLPADGVFASPALEIYVTLLLTTLAAICLGLMISAAVTRRDSVIYVVMLILFVQIIFSGALFELKGPMKGVSYATITRWSLDAIGSTVDMTALDELGELRIERTVNFEQEVPEIPEPRTITDTVRMPVQLVTGATAEAMVPIPRLEMSDPVSVTKQFTETKVFTDTVTGNLHIPYAHEGSHLWGRWGMLVFFAVLFGSGALVFQYRKG